VGDFLGRHRFTLGIFFLNVGLSLAMNNNILSILDSQVNRYFATHQPKNACEWALAITEVSSVFNDLIRVGFSPDEIQSFIDRALSTARLYGMPKSKLEKLARALVIPEEEEGEEDDEEDDELELDEKELDDLDEQLDEEDTEVSLTPAISAKSTPLPILGGCRWR
jgi:hypothetical protein